FVKITDGTTTLDPTTMTTPCSPPTIPDRCGFPGEVRVGQLRLSKPSPAPIPDPGGDLPNDALPILACSPCANPVGFPSGQTPPIATDTLEFQDTCTVSGTCTATGPFGRVVKTDGVAADMIRLRGVQIKGRAANITMVLTYATQSGDLRVVNSS